MGLNGLFLSGLNLIKTLSSLGINESAVRDISKAHASRDAVEIGKTFAVFKRWVWLTAIFGIVVTVCFSPLLSLFSFSSYDHTLDYIWLSVTFVFGALTGGIYTLLRGTRQLKYLAQANVLGGIVGLVVALPIFYFYGIAGVVPAIIITAFANYLVSLYFKSKIHYVAAAIDWKETLALGQPMVKLGISLTLINLLAAFVAFVLSAFISKTGSLSDVGLYNAGLAIVDGYVGMVFTAMATDYFPRLSGVIQDDSKWKQLVNEQAELVLIILSMVLVLLISTTPILIRILLSKEFLTAQDFILWAVLAIPLKGVTWVLGFIILAKGDNKLFLYVETFSNLLVLVFNLSFYYYFGLKGLGISLLISYAIVTILVFQVIRLKYEFKFIKDVYFILMFSMISLSLCIASIYGLGYPHAYFVEAVIVIITCSYSLYELNKRMNLKEVLIKLKSKVSR